jgi:hypothetical protein
VERLASGATVTHFVIQHRLNVLLESDIDQRHREEIEWALPEVEARLTPVFMKPSEIEEYLGTYGSHGVTVADGNLVCTLNDGDPAKLLPMR